MVRLGSSDLRKLLAFVHELYAYRDLHEFVAFVLSHLPTIVPSEVTAYGELDLPRSRAMLRSSPVDIFADGLREAFLAHVHEHPFAQKRFGGGDGEAVKISDLMTRQQFHRTGIYNEGFKVFGVDSEMVVWLPAPSPKEITLAVHRAKRDFSEHDRVLLNVLRPHLARAYSNAEAVSLLARALRTGSQRVVLLARGDSIERTDSRVQQLLVEYFGALPDQADRLPNVLARWVAHQERLLKQDGDAPPPREPLVVSQPGKRLTVRLFAGPAQRLLLFEEQRDAVDGTALAVLGLTRRESEVLRWVAQGKTNEEIGTILGLSPRTVAKHLERMYPRLGVENRTAAAARALEVVRAGGAT